jgi:hypothetical protein
MSLENLTSALQDIHLEPENLPFNPTGQQSWLRNKFNDLARYLFRISTPYSDGTTDDTWARSMDAVERNPRATIDCFARKDQRAVAEELRKHLRWKSKDSDNFVSWTSSLLFAIQYIIFRHASARNGRPALDAIELCVIDTTLFPSGVFVRDLDMIQAYRSFDSTLESLYRIRQSTHYYGEYLSQGSLKIESRCQIVSAAPALKDAGCSASD